jgi:hypothetical protein
MKKMKKAIIKQNVGTDIAKDDFKVCPEYEKVRFAYSEKYPYICPDFYNSSGVHFENRQSSK